MGACEAVVTLANGMLTEPQREAMRDVEVRTASVRGDRAVVLPDDIEMEAVLDPATTEEPINLRKRRGRWLLEDAR